MSDIRFEIHEDGTPEWYDDDLQLLVQINNDSEIVAARKKDNWYHEVDVDSILSFAELIKKAREYADAKEA